MDLLIVREVRPDQEEDDPGAVPLGGGALRQGYVSQGRQGLTPGHPRHRCGVKSDRLLGLHCEQGDQPHSVESQAPAQCQGSTRATAKAGKATKVVCVGACFCEFNFWQRCLSLQVACDSSQALFGRLKSRLTRSV